MKHNLTLITSVLSLALLLMSLITNAQCSVTHVIGSNKTASATGSGYAGTPQLTYTAGLGSKRAVIFVATFERDHTQPATCSQTSLANNFASSGLRSATAPTGDNVAINATWGGKALTLVSHVCNFVGVTPWQTSTDNTGTQLSEEMYTFIIMENDIPAAGGPFLLGGDFQNPKNAGDEAAIVAATYTNVGSYENITGVSGGMPVAANSLSLSTTMISTSQPGNTTTASNMIVTAIVFNKEAGFLTATPGTIINNIAVSNTNGTYMGNICIGSYYTENDGMNIATLLTTGTGAQTIKASVSGAGTLAQMKPLRLVAANCILPVTLTNFTALNKGANVLLNWETASENNNGSFEVEYSINKTLWQTLGTVASRAENGFSNLPLVYNFLHDHPLGDVNYYRLKQIDKDGKSNYSNIQTVKMNNTSLSITAFPNPAFQTTTISGASAGNTIRVVDMAGRIISTQTVSGSPAIVSVNRFSPGVYMIQVFDKDRLFSHFRLVKQ